MKQVYIAYPGKDHPSVDTYRCCPHCQAELVMQEIDHWPRTVCPACGFIHYRNPAATVSLVIVQGDQVLLGRRGGDPAPERWATPSGYIEYEDDFLSTAIREAREETGLEVEIQAILNVTSSFLSPAYHFLNVYLLARVLGGELCAGDDLGAAAWFPLAGPYPELAFEEDADLLAQYATGQLQGLPVDPAYSSGAGIPQATQ